MKNIKVLKELHDFNVRDSVFPDKDHSKNLFIIQQLENGDGTREERKKKKKSRKVCIQFLKNFVVITEIECFISKECVSFYEL